jgi:signal transduction histidine kinase
VEDHGQPIDDELRDTIFEPFVHLHRATAGSGLGLPISRRLARAMGGDLTLAPASDRGNRFQLVLPSA